MLRNPTVLILGAGASHEIGMPLGATLKTEIASFVELQRDRGHVVHTEDNIEAFAEIEALGKFKKDTTRILAAAHQISAGVPFASSIDSFLEIRRDNPDIAQLAKVALVHLILKGERSSNLKTVKMGESYTLKPTAIDGTWYQEFTQLFFEKVDVQSIEYALQRFAVIDFNYDRCFEQVLFHALTGLYNLPRDRASKLVASAQIYHPYGTVGPLHTTHGKKSIEFGGDPKRQYLELSEGIRTFSERMNDNGELEALRRAVGAATTIVFLGCAFHSQNMELIQPPTPEPKIIFGTSYGMSPADNAHVKARLETMFSRIGRSGVVGSPDIRMENLKCAEFLRQFRRTLSAD